MPFHLVLLPVMYFFPLAVFWDPLLGVISFPNEADWLFEDHIIMVLIPLNDLGVAAHRGGVEDP